MKNFALLFALLSLIVAACSSEPKTVEVTGSTGPSVSQVGSSMDAAGLTYTMNWTDVSDDRVAGPNEAVAYCEWVSQEEDSADCHGTFVITNDGGTWAGTFTGTSIENVHDIQGTLMGTGDYEGLQFAYRLQGTEFPWTVTGTIGSVDS